MTKSQYTSAPTLAREQVSGAPVRDLLDLLAELGSTDAIAARLFAAGAIGEPRRSRRCPLSLYVLRETGVQICVGHGGWATLDSSASADGPLPLLVGEFVCRFDIGLYPELDENQPGARATADGDADPLVESDPVDRGDEHECLCTDAHLDNGLHLQYCPRHGSEPDSTLGVGQ